MGSGLARRIAAGIRLLVGLAVLMLAWPGRVQAAAPIVLDGEFGDWVGQACFSDPAGDSLSWPGDLLSFCFASNPDDPTAYFMIERQPSSQYLNVWLNVDTNNDGSYQTSRDRVIRVQYKPEGNHSSVSIDLYSGTGQFLRNLASGVDWGQSLQAGGSKVELGVPLSDLAATGQPLRLYAQSWQGGVPADTTLEAQWSPADGLGLPLLAGLLVSGTMWMGHRQGKRR